MRSETWGHLQLDHHLVKQLPGFGAVGVLKVVLDSNLHYDGLQVTTHT